MGGSDAGRSAQNVGAATGRGRRSGLAERGAGGRRPEQAGRARSLAAVGPHASARMRRTAAAGPHARPCPRRSPRPPRGAHMRAEARGTYAPTERPQRTRRRRATTSPPAHGVVGQANVLLAKKSGRRTVATATLFSSLSGLSSFSPCSPVGLATTPGPSRLSRRGLPRT